MDDACGFVISILSEGQAKKANLWFNSHDMRNPFPEVSDIDEVVLINPPTVQAFKLQKLPPPPT